MTGCELNQPLEVLAKVVSVAPVAADRATKPQLSLPMKRRSPLAESAPPASICTPQPLLTAAAVQIRAPVSAFSLYVTPLKAEMYSAAVAASKTGEALIALPATKDHLTVPFSEKRPRTYEFSEATMTRPPAKDVCSGME